jgi:hypothetical protein
MIQGELLETKIVTPSAKAVTRYIFKETEYLVVMEINGFHYETLCTMFGKEQAKRDAVEDAKRYFYKLGLKPGSDVTFKVIEKTYKIQKKKTGRKWFYDKGQDEYESNGRPFDEDEKTVWSSDDI